MLKLKIKDKVLYFEGVLDETATSANIEEQLTLLMAQSGSKVDFSSVKYANSAGILIWLKVLARLGRPIEYVNAPTWLVNQFNMVPQLINGIHNVVSIKVPFYCSEKDKETYRVMTIGKEIPVMDNYEAYNISPIDEEGDKFVPDILPQKFFSFIAKNKDLFKKAS